MKVNGVSKSTYNIKKLNTSKYMVDERWISGAYLEYGRGGCSAAREARRDFDHTPFSPRKMGVYSNIANGVILTV